MRRRGVGKIGGYDPNYPIGQNADVFGVYSLRRWWGWDKSFLLVVRASDSQERYLFFSDGEYQLSLNSITSTDPTTQTGTSTLSAWGAGTHVYIKYFMRQSSDLVTASNYFLYQASGSATSWARITTSGALITDTTTGYPVATLQYTTVDRQYIPNSGTWNNPNGINSATIIGVAASLNASSNETIFTTAIGGNALTQRLSLLIETASNRIGLIRTSAGQVQTSLLSAFTPSDLHYFTLVKNASEIFGYFDGTDQTAKTAWSGTFSSNSICLFQQASTQNLKGNFYELICINEDIEDAGVADEIFDNLNYYFNL